jgi:5'-deoxynucleotidase YfbR-like HD superfamily hydrolase
MRKELNLQKIYSLQSSTEQLQPNQFPEIRTDLISIILQGKDIKRHVYSNFPEIVRDNVLIHKLRCISIVKLLDIPESNKATTFQILLLHDVPEIIVLKEKGLDHDLTAPEKAVNPRLAKRIELEEKRKAKEIFSKEEIDLINLYKHAGKLLNGEEVGSYIDPAGLYAKYIDTIDANIISHLRISNYVKSKPRYDINSFPPEALTFTFQVHKQYASNLHRIKNEITIDTCKLLSDTALKFVRSCWENVEPEVIPKYLIRYLE